MPVVVTNAMDAWPAFKAGDRKWSMEFFKKSYGDVKPGSGIDTAGKKEYTSLGEYLSRFDQYAQVPRYSSATCHHQLSICEYLCLASFFLAKPVARVFPVC